MNLVVLKGRLGADAEMKEVGNGKTVCTLSLATSRGQGSKTQWHKVEFWDRSAEILSTLRKGAELMVRGSIDYDSYTDRNGVKKHTTRIKGWEFDFCGPRKDQAPRQDEGHRTGAVGPATNPFEDDNVPF